MNRSAIAVIAIWLLSGASAFGADSGASRSQTTRMGQCSTEAKSKGLKGDARKAFMSQCLRKPGAQAAAAKACNGAAAEKGLKGAQRKAFVADCIRSKENAADAGDGPAA